MALDARALEGALSGPRTLVVAPNWVGDVAMALPALEALAAAGRELAVLARPGLAPLLALSPAVSEVVERGRSDGETVARLRRAGCAEAVVLPNSFRSAWLPFRAGIPRRWGYRGNLRSPLLAPAVRRPRGPKRHQVEDYRELLEAIGAPAAGATPRLALDGAARAAGEDALARARVPEAGGPLVGLFPGAEFGPSKRWPVERFGELARTLRKRIPRVRIVVLSGPKEIWLAVRVYEEAAGAAPVVGADLDLAGLAGVLARLDLLVTNDSGPMHLAAALGVPCVALFGPTDPERTRPAGAGHEVLYTARWCSPCFRRRCPLLHHRCLKDIGVERVAAAAERALAGTTR